MNKDIFETYSKGKLLIPDILGLGWCHTDLPRFGGHRQDGEVCYEIGYIESGSIEWWVNGQLDEVGPGSITIDRPGEWQGGQNALIHPCERYWVRFNFPPDHDLTGLDPNVVNHLKREFEGMNHRHFPASENIRQHFEQLVAEHRNPGLLAASVVRSALHQILILTVRDYHRQISTSLSTSTQKAIDLMLERNSEPLSMDEIANLVNLSTGYFHRLFLKEIGIAPHKYYLRMRILAAKKALIISDDSIIQIAMDGGFNTSQYFATAFRRLVGISPKEYREMRENSIVNSP